MKKTVSILFAACLLLGSCGSAKTTSENKTTSSIISGTVWLDINGNLMNAHGAGVLYYNGTYYLYGEYKGGSTYWNPKVPGWECYRTEAGGVSCYSSKIWLTGNSKV